MRVITEEDLLQVLGLQLGIAYSPDLKADDVDVELATSIPIGFAKQHRLLLIKRDGDAAMVATADPLEVGALDDLRMQLSLDVQPVLVPSQRILDVINDVYGRRADKGGELAKEEDEEDDGRQRGAGRHPRRHRRGADHPLGQLAAVPGGQGARQRYPHRAGREGGHRPLPHRRRAVRGRERAARQFMPSIIARVKIMAGLNIAEKRLPQDGRIRRKIAGKDIDMRVATAPTAERASASPSVCSTASSVLLDLADIGFGDDHLAADATTSSTGRTASCWSPGRPAPARRPRSTPASPRSTRPTSTSSPSRIRSSTSSTASRRPQVNAKIDLTFAAGLRSFLRHDPDVIMVGEIRDRETAEIAIQASLTGHLVLSTIHTNDAAGAITRLVDMGVEPFLVASSLVALLAQRLVRRAVRRVPRAVPPRRRGPGQHRHRSGGVRARPGAARALQGRRGVGAAARDAVPRARGRLPGLPGRRLQGPDGIYELLIIDEKIRQLTIKNADAQTIKNDAIRRGMRTLREDGAQKVLAGMTTTAEVLMITTQDVE